MKYSIILPAFNGGEYLKQCVGSILKQSYVGFNLLVLDSGSTDGSVEWMKSVNDSRIKVHTSSKRLSIEENWSRIISVPKNEFMTIIGHDDLLEKDYLQKMDELIHRHPDASLYQSHFHFIDENGNVIRRCKRMQKNISSDQLLELFLTSSIDTIGTGFIFRSKDFSELGGMPLYPKLLFSDMELWQKLAAKSFLSVEQANLFFFRRHAEATTASTDVTLIIQALNQFVEFLNRLKTTDPKCAGVINKNANTLLMQYCQGLSHKVLRTGKNKRDNISVNRVIDQFRELGRKLNLNPSFEPMEHFRIRLGKIIDGNNFFHQLYLSFRRFFGKPIFK
jgi:glycosyltransferase involved in cell wall biosynthesis